MKRWLILGLVLALVVAITVPAGAKMFLVGKNEDGAFYVLDRVFNKKGDCFTVPTLFMNQELKKTPYGMVKAVARAMRVCCRAQTYQVLAYGFLGPAPERKTLHTEQVSPTVAKVFKARPGTLAFYLIQKVCAPGFPK